jgi:hypothetical protein
MGHGRNQDPGAGGEEGPVGSGVNDHPAAKPLRVTYRAEGGFGYFPGLARPLTVDSASLSAAEAAHLRTLVDGALQAAGAAGPAAQRGVPDGRRYTISIEGAGRKRTLRLADPLGDERLEALVAYLEGLRRGHG